MKCISISPFQIYAYINLKCPNEIMLFSMDLKTELDKFRERAKIIKVSQNESVERLKMLLSKLLSIKPSKTEHFIKLNGVDYVKLHPILLEQAQLFENYISATGMQDDFVLIRDDHSHNVICVRL